MLIKLILLFSLIPLIELAILIEIGSRLGVIFTVALVALTGVVGVTLARDQGFKIIGRVKSDLNQGQLPADDLMGGLLILCGGLFLLTPGLLTDLAGFSLIIPFTRILYISILKRKLKGYLLKHNIDTSSFYFNDNGFAEDNSVDVEFEEVESDKKEGDW